MLSVQSIIALTVKSCSRQKWGTCEATDGVAPNQRDAGVSSNRGELCLGLLVLLAWLLTKNQIPE